jgi:hypothetical protein
LFMSIQCRYVHSNWFTNDEQGIILRHQPV